MTNLLVKRRLTVAAFVLLSCCLGHARQAADRTLGDAARQVRQSHEASKPKTTPTIYTNAEVASTVTAEQTAASPAPDTPSVPSKKAEPSAQDKSGRNSQAATKTSILDRPRDSTPDEIVVPAGTEIRVDIEERKVVKPVRVGFATPIPALSKVSLRVDRRYVPYDYVINGSSYVDYVDYATLTAITIVDSSYDVQADEQPLLKGATNRDVTFVLNAPLKIPR